MSKLFPILYILNANTIYIFLSQIDMEAPEFRDFAKSMVDYIAEYLENIRDR